MAARAPPTQGSPQLYWGQHWPACGAAGMGTSPSSGQTGGGGQGCVRQRKVRATPSQVHSWQSTVTVWPGCKGGTREPRPSASHTAQRQLGGPGTQQSRQEGASDAWAAPEARGGGAQRWGRQQCGRLASALTVAKRSSRGPSRGQAQPASGPPHMGASPVLPPVLGGVPTPCEPHSPPQAPRGAPGSLEGQRDQGNCRAATDPGPRHDKKPRGAAVQQLGWKAHPASPRPGRRTYCGSRRAHRCPRLC